MARLPEFLRRLTFQLPDNCLDIVSVPGNDSVDVLWQNRTRPESQTASVHGMGETAPDPLSLSPAESDSGILQP